MGITRAEEEEIEGRWPKSIQRQRIELLRKWKQKRRGMRHGKKRNTYRSLCNTFLKSGNVALAEKGCDVLCGGGNYSESSGESEEEKEEDLASPPRKKLKASSPCVQSVHTGSKADLLEDLAHLLRMSYGCRPPSFIVLQWPPPPTLKVFNLAMIHSKDIVRRMPLDEDLVRLTLRGSVNDIMKRKTALKLKDLFQCGDKKGKVVLVEGAPGSGKSTLSWDIVLKWVKQELFHDDFKIVIYVQFRDLDVQSATEIADLLPLMKLEQKDATSVIVGCRGKGVLFVLDGWDEYSPGLQPDSLFDKLICHPEKLGVPLSTVLITSRPIASGKLQLYATSRVEIVGFVPDEVGRYFEDIFKDPVKVQKLYDHLKERPTIKASCYLPLNAAIVAHLFMELNYTLPTTLHGLFCSLILSCIIRHLTKESETQPTITSLDELPPSVQEVFENICILAYEGTMDNKVIFSCRDLHSYGLPENLSTLSLMQVVQSFATGKPSSYHFLHLSIQELLTALHISKLPPPEQVQIFTKLFGQPRFDAVFRFYAAFTKLQTEGIRSIITPMISMRSEEEKRRLLNLMHCLYEAQDTSLCYFVCSQLQRRLDLTNITLSPMDLLSLKYFLFCVNSSSRTESSDRISTVHLGGCELTPVDIDSLSLHNHVMLFLTASRVSCACAANLFTSSPQLKVLNLAGCSLTDDGVELFAAALREHRSLEDLNMDRCTNSSHVMHYVLQAVLNHRSLQRLDIVNCPVDLKDIAAVLEANKSLRVLAISADSDSMILARSLKKNRTLKKLVVDLNIRPDWIEEFVWRLRDCHLKTLHVYRFHGIVSSLRQHRVDRVNAVRRDRGLPLLEII